MPIRPPTVRDGFRHVFNQYVVEVEHRDALQAHLRIAGIGTAIYYRIPMHMQECFAHLGYRPGDCPVAERFARRSLALPVYPEMTIEQQDHVLDMLAGFYHSRRS
jgi:dTDP-4-amino-4,6-dideoxygalactose transaminase